MDKHNEIHKVEVRYRIGFWRVVLILLLSAVLFPLIFILFLLGLSWCL